MNDMMFKVDKKHGVVVCTLYNCKDIPLKRIDKYLTNMSIRDASKYCIKDKYTGVAKCAPDDKFDEEHGKKLALRRAKNKRCRAINAAVVACYVDAHNKFANMLKFGTHRLIDESEE